MDARAIFIDWANSVTMPTERFVYHSWKIAFFWRVWNPKGLAAKDVVRMERTLSNPNRICKKL